MNDRIGYEDPRMQRMEQATLWLQRMRTTGQDDRIVEEWLDWCQSDPLNQQAFDDIAAIWEISGQLPREPAVAAAKPRAKVLWRALAASIVVLGLSGIGGAWWLEQLRDKVLTAEFVSPLGVNSVKTLADGSALVLGGNTRVTVSIGAHARRIELHEGELFVTVSHDKSRPFSVASGNFEVVATGTAFNVLRSSARTTVTVTEGSVAAFHEGRDAPTNVRLKAGQQLIYSHALHSSDVREVDTAQAIAWRTGMLFFQDEPLSEVLASVNRYATGPIVITDPQLGERTYTGSALTSTSGIERWLEGMSLTFHVSVVKLPNGRRSMGPLPAARSD